LLGPTSRAIAIRRNPERREPVLRRPLLPSLSSPARRSPLQCCALPGVPARGFALSPRHDDQILTYPDLALASRCAAAQSIARHSPARQSDSIQSVAPVALPGGAIHSLAAPAGTWQSVAPEASRSLAAHDNPRQGRASLTTAAHRRPSLTYPSRAMPLLPILTDPWRGAASLCSAWFRPAILCSPLPGKARPSTALFPIPHVAIRRKTRRGQSFRASAIHSIADLPRALLTYASRDKADLSIALFPLPCAARPSIGPAFHSSPRLRVPLFPIPGDPSLANPRHHAARHPCAGRSVVTHPVARQSEPGRSTAGPRVVPDPFQDPARPSDAIQCPAIPRGSVQTSARPGAPSRSAVPGPVARRSSARRGVAILSRARRSIALFPVRYDTRHGKARHRVPSRYPALLAQAMQSAAVQRAPVRGGPWQAPVI